MGSGMVVIKIRNNPDIIHAEYNKDENIVNVYSGRKLCKAKSFSTSLGKKIVRATNILEATLDWNHNGKHQITFIINIIFA